MRDRDDLLRLRCTDRDWAVWCDRARADDAWAATQAHERRVASARQAISEFCAGERGYIGVSWGKDSCALLLLTLQEGIDWPVVHVWLDPVGNPDCALVRDAWLDRYPNIADRYHEIRVQCAPKPSTRRYDTNRGYAEGFGEAARRFGERYLSGVRAEESGARKLSMLRNGRGCSRSRTARPIGWWQSEDVFALLRYSHLHPAYPCTMGGIIDRHRVRVNNLWGLYGEGHGRAEWERAYYGDALREIERRHRSSTPC